MVLLPLRFQPQRHSEKRFHLCFAAVKSSSVPGESCTTETLPADSQPMCVCEFVCACVCFMVDLFLHPHKEDILPPLSPRSDKELLDKISPLTLRPGGRSVRVDLSIKS